MDQLKHLSTHLKREANSKRFIQRILAWLQKGMIAVCFALSVTMAHAQDQTLPPPDPPPPNNLVASPTNVPVVTTQTSAPAITQNMSEEQFKQWLAINTVSRNSDKTYPPGFVTQVQKDDTFPPANAPPPRRRIPPPLTYEQRLNAMINSIPPNSPQPSPDSMAAFNALLQQNVPLTPQQVVLLRQHIDMSQRAAAIPATVPPKPVSSTIMINLSPGTTPPVIRLAQGYVSSLVFVDSTGTAWPIAAFDIGNPKAVNVQWDGKSNIILLQAVQPYSNGDIVVRLAGLPTPITLELVSGQRVVDYRVDLHVPGIGPNTKDIPLGTALPNSASELLLDVLNGVAPAGSRLLMVRGADAQAWMLGERLYLRTRFTVLSPGWVGKMTSADGMQAYELPRTSSVLISRYGEPAELKIEGL